MRWLLPILLALGLGIPTSAADQPERSPTALCADGVPGAPACTVSKKSRKQARAAFARGMKLQTAQRLQEAFDEFETAGRLVPQDLEYVTAREMARQQLVAERLARGNAALLDGRQVQALAEFRGALHLDPQNEFAQQRLRDALGEWAPKTSAPLQVLADAGEIQPSPQPEPRDFHYRGDSRGLLTTVAGAYGVTAIFDDSVLSRKARFDIDPVDFYTALRAACQVTKTFWTPLGEKQVLLAADTPENHRQFDQMAMRSFYVPGISAPTELNDLANVMRSVFDIRFVAQQPRTSTLIVRAPRPVLDAATRVLAGLDASRPQVLLDVKVYAVSHTVVRNLGLNIPNQFRMFNIPAGALALLGGQSIQDLINQLISSGGINQANSTAISALLAQLQSQQSSIFSQPFATFGGGLTLFGLTLGTASATAQLNEISVKSLEHLALRASEGQDATFRVGTRFPILNASFAPIFNTAAISQVIQNNSFRPAFPSFSYEDLGVSLKAKPQVHGNNDVSLALEMQIRALEGPSLNGVPVISNREYKGSITLRNGEPAVVAGSVSRTEQRSLGGIPGLGQVPGLKKITASNNKEEDEDELLVVITPHVVKGHEAHPGSEVWMSSEK